MNYADELYAADHRVGLLEETLFDMLEGWDHWEDWSRDSYDWSVELYGVTPGAKLTPEIVTKFKDAGFAIVWLNHTDGGETTYSLANEAEYYKMTDGYRKGHVSPTEKALRREITQLRAVLSESHNL